MARTTGFTTAIVAQMIESEGLPPGVHALELVIDANKLSKKLALRGIKIQDS
jgi:hypothetical protein